MALLSPSNVVFYHPLDNLTEHTQSQAWSGTAGFTAGKIGSANSALTGDAFSFTAGGAWTTATVGKDISVAGLSSTSVVVKYVNASNNNVRAGVVSGSDVTWGAEFTVGPTGPAGVVGHQSDAVALSSTTFLVAYHANGVGGATGRVVVGTVSGTDITFGAEGLTSTTAQLRASVFTKLVDGTKALIMYADNTAGVLYAAVVSVTGTTPTLGTSITVDTAASSDIVGRTAHVAALSATSAVGTWSNSANAKAAVLTVSGTDVTIGPTKALTASFTLANGRGTRVAKLTATTCAIAYIASGAIQIRVCTVAGTDITIGTENSIAGIQLRKLTATSATKLVLHKRSGGPNNEDTLTTLTVSGTTVTVDADSNITVSIATEAGSTMLDSSTVVTALKFGGSFDSSIGLLGLSSAITASTPGAYPAASGNDRVVVALWANKLGSGASNVIIQRDFTVVFDATSISLGPATSTWSAAAITTLMSTMAGGEHFLVLDFEHTGAGSWTLNTSLDGAAFVLQGAESSGSRTTAPATLTPGLSITAGVSGQWVDEAVMWAGDKATFVTFTTQELANLQDLADINGDTMDQYSQNFGLVSINMASDPSGIAITVSPNDNGGNGNGTTPFSRDYGNGTNVTLAAPTTSANRTFTGWRNGVGDTLSLSRSFVLTVTIANTVTAHYESIGDSRNDHNVASP